MRKIDLSGTKLRRSILFAAPFLILILLGFALWRPLLCSIIPYQLTDSYIVVVPVKDAATYNRDISLFMSARGLDPVSATFETHEPLGAMSAFIGHQIEGCDGSSYIWSGNDSRADEYLVTFYRSPLFADRTGPLKRAFLAEVQRRFKVRPYGEPERPRSAG
jgi:hypothetical protein